MEKKIAVLPGDGIGKEVTEGAASVLTAVAERFGHHFHFQYGLIGGAAIDETGHPLPDETITLCTESDAVLLGAVGGPKWDAQPPENRPERGLLAIRKHLELYANLRPISFHESLSEASPLRREVIQDADFVIVRELTGGLYFGKPSQRITGGGQDSAVDTLHYHRYEIKRILELAFQMAEKRRGKVTSVDKANVLESSRLWREVAEETAGKYPSVTLEHMLVDNAAMQLIKNPRQFDVLVTENMFGDILSDEASVLTGSLGMLPSASISVNGPHLYEPIHGSAPDIAGQDKANPIAAILSAASMLRTSFGLKQEAEAVEAAVREVLAAGFRTADIAGERRDVSTTAQMTEEIRNAILGHEAISQIMDCYA
ncbi:3-isopropylmalate dehydrogenase [Peribacillus sp. SCS-37]|uniref:3-isopropylmalate dehydrogenase n=1 Tax=Paraperibacillus esterisolvens TaxID=3115296 RepID=UPI0039062388